MNNKKKLLIFESISYIAGGQGVLLNLLPYLIKEFAVTVVLPENGLLKDKLDELGVSVIFINPGSYTLGQKNIWQIIKYVWFSLAICWRVFLLAKKFDLIYINSARWLPAVVWSDFLACRPIFFHNHSLISDKKSLWLVETSARSMNVKKIFAASESIVSQTAELRAKTVIIYNGINPEIFYPAVNRVANNILEIGVVGDVIPTKGQDRLLRALATLDNHQWHLKIIGGPRPGSEFFFKELRDLAVSLQISNQVDFLGRQEKVVDHLRTLDLLVLPSIVPEGSSLAVIEALACAVPVIASDLGGTKELIVDGENGFLYDGQENSLRLVLNKFFTMSEVDRQTVAKKAYSSFLEKYQLKDIAEKVINFIKESI